MDSLKDILGEISRKLSKSRIFLSGDVSADMVAGVQVDALVSEIESSIQKNESDLYFATKDDVEKAVAKLSRVKAPEPIEVIQSPDFKPVAAEVDAIYSIKNRPVERAEGTVNDFIMYFRSRLKKIKSILGSRLNGSGIINSLESLKEFASGKQVAIAGIVTSKITTKNGNIMVVLEDETAEAKVIFMNSSSQKAKELFSSASAIINDEVIAVKGKISGPFVIANEIMWPDVPIKTQKKVEDDIAIAFLSDIHVGSKLFMERNFSKMIKWLAGGIDDKSRTLAGKIKYIIMAGDVADGIGVYPEQDKDLAVPDIYMQYKMLAGYIEAIPDYIHVFVLPGNHDAVQRAEPQPSFSPDMLEVDKDNVHILQNPSIMNLHGLDVLAYHGTSLDSIIAAVPGMSYSKPETAMIELLKRRHLSPVYGGNVVVPSRNDNLVIEEPPDILHMGHIHKNGLAEYHGVKIVNSGTWQGRTEFQIRQGHIPTPCLLPIFSMKDYTFTNIDFNSV
ncbi:MAG: DNA-directed DNA polymerase II small subunit [Candidatus Micrarchaeaceae archaeon]